MWTESCVSPRNDRNTHIQCQPAHVCLIIQLQRVHMYTLPNISHVRIHSQVNNACATGSSALMLAQQLVQGGIADCVMALGFEKMERGSLTAKVCNPFHL